MYEVMLRWLRSLFGKIPKPVRAAPTAPAPVPTPALREAAPDEATDELTTEAIVAMVSGPFDRTPDPEVVASLAERIVAELSTSTFTIPPFPSSVSRVLELIEQPDLDLNKLVHALHWEPSVVAQIVSVANSAAFRRGTCDDLRGALLALGLAEVGSIAAGVSAQSFYEVGSKAELDLYPELWGAVHRDALVIAFTASWLAQARHVPRYDRVFLRSVIAGMAPMLGLRALGAQLLDGRCPKHRTEEISAAVDSVRDQTYAIAIERWALPPAVASVVDPASQTERVVVELTTALLELRRHPYRVSAALAIRDHARTLGLDVKWLKVLVGECDSATERVIATLTPTPAKKLAGRAGR